MLVDRDCHLVIDGLQRGSAADEHTVSLGALLVLLLITGVRGIAIISGLLIDNLGRFLNLKFGLFLNL